MVGKRLQGFKRLSLLAFIFCTFLASCHGHDAEFTTPLPVVSAVSEGATVTGVVALGQVNRYTVPVQRGATYKISITQVSDDVDLIFFGTDATLQNPAACSIDNTRITGLLPEDCVFTAPGGQLYFSVDGRSLARSTVASYTLAIESVSTTDMTQSLPILDSTTRTGAIAYAVPVTAGASYTLAITELDDDADLHVFRDADLTQPAVCAFNNLLFPGSTPEDCTLTADTSYFYLVVDGLFSSNADVLFTAFASPSAAVPAPANEGSVDSPRTLSLGTITGGQVATESLYVVNGTTPGSEYTVSINGLTGNVDLTVYSDDTFGSAATCSIDNTFHGSTMPESCTLTASGNSLYFTVTANSVPAGFLMLAEPGPRF